MFTYDGDQVIITCDKCWRQENAHKDEYNNRFYESGWVMNSNAKKHKHKCYSCLTKREKKAFDFVKDNFPIK